MTDPSHTPPSREFRCRHCQGKVVIPYQLPPTTGPCPHCAGVITSPSLEEFLASQQSPAPFAAAPAAPPAAPIPPGEPKPEPGPISSSSPASPHEPAPDAASGPASPTAAEAPAGAPPREEAKSPRRRSAIIPVMLVLLVLILATGAAVYYATLQMGRQIDPPSLSTLPVNPEVAENHYIRVGWKIDASEQLAGFLAAATIDEKLAFVLEPERIRPLMERLYGPLPHRESDTPIEAYSLHELSEQDRRRGIFMMIFDRPPQVDMREFFRPLASLEVQHSLTEADMLLSAVARLDNFELEPIRAHAFFKRTSAGLKLDWEVFVQTKYRTLRDFIELPEAEASAVFRVIIMEDVPPKGTAVAGTRTYRFTCPANHGDSARVNVPVDSDLGRELAVLNWRGTEGATPIARTATIEVTWSKDAGNPELTLSRFLCWEFLGLGGSAP